MPNYERYMQRLSAICDKHSLYLSDDAMVTAEFQAENVAENIATEMLDILALHWGDYSTDRCIGTGHLKDLLAFAQVCAVRLA